MDQVEAQRRRRLVRQLEAAARIPEAATPEAARALLLELAVLVATVVAEA